MVGDVRLQPSSSLESLGLVWRNFPNKLKYLVFPFSDPSNRWRLTPFVVPTGICIRQSPQFPELSPRDDTFTMKVTFNLP